VLLAAALFLLGKHVLYNQMGRCQTIYTPVKKSLNQGHVMKSISTVVVAVMLCCLLLSACVKTAQPQPLINLSADTRVL
jgi:NADH:ubiquinone oxidoreductase subunit 5 (subunit L)/multisubunit Na+/H+ antiporter MnhA subunit